MERSDKVPLKKCPCRFYLKSRCLAGNRCRFLHDRSLAQYSNICSFYLKGRCRYGNMCRYDHLTINTGEPEDFKRFQTKSAGNGGSSSSIRTPVTFACEVNEVGTLGFNNSSLSDKRDTDAMQWKDISPADSTILDVTKLPKNVPKSHCNDVEMNNNRQSFDSKLADVQIVSDNINVSEVSKDSCMSIKFEKEEPSGSTTLLPCGSDQKSSNKIMNNTEPARNVEFPPARLRSMDKICSICLEVVMDRKGTNDRRFGILENCNHVFCLSCISKWRKIKPDMSLASRTCPECRVFSNFFMPSQFWIHDVGDKEKLIDNFKRELSRRPCRYFKHGLGHCLLGSSCLYFHAHPDGTLAVLPPPVLRASPSQSSSLDDIEELTELTDFANESDDNDDAYHENNLTFFTNINFNDLLPVLILRGESDEESYVSSSDDCPCN